MDCLRNHVGDHLVERFRLNRILRSAPPHTSGTHQIMIRMTTREGTVIEIRTHGLATGQALLRKQEGRVPFCTWMIVPHLWRPGRRCRCSTSCVDRSASRTVRGGCNRTGESEVGARRGLALHRHYHERQVGEIRVVGQASAGHEVRQREQHRVHALG